MKFAYNNSFQATIGMAPYKVLYGGKCIPPIHWDKVGERKLVGPEILQQTQDVVVKIRENQDCSRST